MQQTAQVTPLPFFDVVTGYQRSAAMKTAVELDVFTKIGEGNSTAADIARAVGAAERGVRILCDCLTVMGFLNKDEGKYALNDLSSTFLDTRSPMFIGRAVDFLMSDAQKRGFEELTETVRRGGSAISGDASMDADSEMWVKFARGMMPLMYPTAEQVSGLIGLPTDAKIKILDVAAGHGLFGILAAKRYPNAEVFGADWQNVLAVALENAATFGVADRYHTIPGDAFETDFGTDYDVILVPNFLHHFDKEACTKFLEKCHASLKSDGRVITVEFVPNDDRVSPPMEAMFALVMLAATPGGDAYTFSELKEMAENAGFTRNEIVTLEPMPSHVITSLK